MCSAPTLGVTASLAARIPTEEKAFADIRAICVMDASNNGVIFLADKMLSLRQHGVPISGPQARLMKLGFEKALHLDGPERICDPAVV